MISLTSGAMMDAVTGDMFHPLIMLETIVQQHNAFCGLQVEKIIKALHSFTEDCVWSNEWGNDNNY